MSTINGILNGLKVTSKGIVASVQIHPLPDGIELRADAHDYDWGDFVAAEELMQQVVDALSIYYHVPHEIGINRKWFPLPDGSVNGTKPIDLKKVGTAHDLLEASNTSRILRSVLRVVQRADQCENWSDRLLLLWMAFNTLYSTSNRSAERAKIEHYIADRHFTLEEIKPWVDSWLETDGFEGLITSSLTLHKWNMSVIFIAEELSGAVENVVKLGQGYEDFMSKLLLTIYALRNRFFYGEERVDEQELEKAIVMAARSLDFVVRASVQKNLGLAVTSADGKPISIAA